MVQHLATLPSVDVTQGSADGLSPFMVACFHGSLEVAQFLSTQSRIDVH